MNCTVKYVPQFIDDFNRLSKQEKLLVRSAIDKIRDNPHSKADGGFGRLLMYFPNECLLTVKIIFTDIRIVYKLIKQDDESLTVIFAAVMNDTAKSII
ncbi:MAG: hypothetical protein II685_04870 [Clostridia bacterium]|nr:hypothetical protein [Clostridia bacterium]